MKYMLLIHQGDTPTPQTDEWERLSEDEQGAVYAAYKALNETPGVTPGVQMQPFAELKEAIGGYCFFEADDLDAAIEVAARIPAAGMGGAIEVRPLVER
jgi:hypothetical protein